MFLLCSFCGLYNLALAVIQASVTWLSETLSIFLSSSRATSNLSYIIQRTPAFGRICRIKPYSQSFVKRRIRPIHHAADPSVFYGIEMNVIDVRGIILVIADRVLPKSSLPNPAFAFDSLLAERNSPSGICFENSVLIACQRAE